MKYSQSLSSGYVQWLGSAYGPALRLTALAGLAVGAVLVRRGLARSDLSSVTGGREVLRPAVMQRCLTLGGRFLDFAWKRKGGN
jgi:hypothetical protein